MDSFVLKTRLFFSYRFGFKIGKTKIYSFLFFFVKIVILDEQNGERNMLRKCMAHPVNEQNNNEMMLQLNQIQIQIKSTHKYIQESYFVAFSSFF